MKLRSYICALREKKDTVIIASKGQVLVYFSNRRVNYLKINRPRKKFLFLTSLFITHQVSGPNMLSLGKQPFQRI